MARLLYEVKEKMNELANYQEMCVFSYSTTHLSKTDKIRFFYALNGRPGEKGIIHHTRTTRLGRAVLLVKKERAEQIKEFLIYWGCEYILRDLLVESKD